MTSKLRNKKTVVFGVSFDSKKEAGRYIQLKSLLDSGHISGLETQKTFELISRQKKRNGKAERACTYRADFFYIRDGVNVVEDVKGMKKGTAYALFVIKRKLMLEKHGIEIKEI